MSVILSINYQTEYASDQLPSNAMVITGSTVPPNYRPTLTQEGMTFEGWYTSNTYETLVDDNYVIPVDATSPFTLYAKWSVISVKTKMTAIADEIRTLSGTTGTMGLDAMATNVGNANSEIVDQNGVLEQIKSALEGKAVSGGGSVEMCTVTGNGIPGECYYSDGTQIYRDLESLYYGNSIIVAKNSLLFIFSQGDAIDLTISGDGEILWSNFNSASIAIYGDCELA